MTDWNTLTAARTLWMEARSETLAGQQAVAHVIVNRRNSGRWGDTLAMVCLWNVHSKTGGQGFQFSGWREQDPNFKAACEATDDSLSSFVALIVAAETEPDPTNGADHYYAPLVCAEPDWVPGATPCGKFGTQLFFKNVK